MQTYFRITMTGMLVCFTAGIVTTSIFGYEKLGFQIASGALIFLAALVAGVIWD